MPTPTPPKPIVTSEPKSRAPDRCTKLEHIAELAYELDRLYSASIKLEEKPAFSELDQQTKKNIIDGVAFVARTPRCVPAQIHENWRKLHQELGWKFAEDGVLNREAKLHPWLLPFNRVPQHIRVKTYLFHSVVTTAVREIGTTGNVVYVEAPKTEQATS